MILDPPGLEGGGGGLEGAGDVGNSLYGTAEKRLMYRSAGVENCSVQLQISISVVVVLHTCNLSNIEHHNTKFSQLTL